MGLNWGAFGVVFVVALVAAVAVTVLVAFALVALSSRATPAGQLAEGEVAYKPLMSRSTGTAVGGVCLAAAALIVLFGLYIIVA
jgi:hypothetical protein